LRFTYSEVTNRSRAESAMFRSLARFCNARFNAPGATNLISTSLMFFLSLLDICGTRLRPHFQYKHSGIGVVKTQKLVKLPDEKDVGYGEDRSGTSHLAPAANHAQAARVGEPNRGVGPKREYRWVRTGACEPTNIDA